MHLYLALILCYMLRQIVNATSFPDDHRPVLLPRGRKPPWKRLGAQQPAQNKSPTSQATEQSTSQGKSPSSKSAKKKPSPSEGGKGSTPESKDKAFQSAMAKLTDATSQLKDAAASAAAPGQASSSKSGRRSRSPSPAGSSGSSSSLWSTDTIQQGPLSDTDAGTSRRSKKSSKKSYEKTLEASMGKLTLQPNLRSSGPVGKAKAKLSVHGPGGAVRSEGSRPAEPIKVGKAQGHKSTSRHDEIVVTYGHAHGIRGSNKGDAIALRLESGPNSAAFFEDRSDKGPYKFKDSRKQWVPPNGMIDKKFRGKDGKRASIRYGINGEGRAQSMAMMRSETVDPEESMQSWKWPSDSVAELRAAGG